MTDAQAEGSATAEALIPLSGPYLHARFVRREKRFIVYAELLDGPQAGEVVKAHLADPGRLPYLMREGQTLLLTGPFPPPRRLAWSVKLAKLGPDRWTSLDTTLANKVVPRLIERGVFPQLPPAATMRREVKRGGSRLDLCWTLEDGREHWGEIKTVSLVHPDLRGAWPDAPSERGRKHLEHLIEHARSGQPASLIFLTYRPEITHIVPERPIDPAFGELLVEAKAVGVQLLARRTRVTPEGVFDVGDVAVQVEET